MTTQLTAIDYVIIGIYVLFALGTGSLFFKEASKGIDSFFVGDRKLPWWIAGTSIVATTFAADTPLAITGIVAADGISGNWIWWSWAIAHLSATFFFARLWKRSGVITDAEITELRYSGKPAAALRAFKAVYFGLFINCLTMAWVIAAMVKISQAFFEVSPGFVIVACVAVSVVYTTLGGFRGVVITDLVQFALGMAGAIVLSWMAVDKMGGIGVLPSTDATGITTPGSGLMGKLVEVTAQSGRTIHDVIDFLPPMDHPTLPPIFFATLLLAGWWRYAEGNGYIVQRLAACRDEGQSQAASLWFSVAHNALRPWPWILVALVSLVVFPRFADHGALEASVTKRTGQTITVTVTPSVLDLYKGGTLSLQGVPAKCSAKLGGKSVPLVADSAPGRTQAVFEGSPSANKSGLFSLAIHCPVEVGFPSFTFEQPMRIELLDRELGYPLLMGRFLPAGLLGLVIASLLAAFMSTIDTHTNWGASYLVQDIYRRFIKPDADEAHYVRVSRACILLMAILAGISALFVHNIASVWKFLITLGAGLGSVTAARWYWSRVTPQAEFAAMGVTTVLAVSLQLFCTKTLFGGENALFFFEVKGYAQILIIAGASLATWIPVALWGPKNDLDTLKAFVAKVDPPGPGWKAVRRAELRGQEQGMPKSQNDMGRAVLSFAAGVVVVFGTLFGLGDLLIGNPMRGALLCGIASLCLLGILMAGKGQDHDDNIAGDE